MNSGRSSQPTVDPNEVGRRRTYRFTGGRVESPSTRLLALDLKLLDLDAPLGDLAAVMAEVCETHGFFRLPLSAIPRPVADAAWEAMVEFFALPEAQKRTVEFPEPGYPYGYAPFKFESLARSRGSVAPPDLKESFSVGPDCDADARATAGSEWVRSPSLWPAEPSGMRDAWVAYYQALAQVAEHLMSVMAVALDLPADFFASMIDNPISSLRALRYPTTDPTTAGESLRAGAHGDYGTLTILRTDAVPGLEIEGPGGGWLPIDPVPDTFVVNLGDSIAQWTNDTWRSTVHRVAVGTGEERHSMAFFHMANWDAVVECLPSCRPEHGEPTHAPVEAGPWLMQRFQATVVDG